MSVRDKSLQYQQNQLITLIITQQLHNKEKTKQVLGNVGDYIQRSS